jgi:hypothetical protein
VTSKEREVIEAAIEEVERKRCPDDPGYEDCGCKTSRLARAVAALTAE